MIRGQIERIQQSANADSRLAQMKAAKTMAVASPLKFSPYRLMEKKGKRNML